MLLMPTRRPAASTNGPPEFPGARRTSATIQRGWPLREVKYEHATLEELFVQVTANQAMARVEEETAA